MFARYTLILLGLTALITLLASGEILAQGETTRASVDSTGAQADNDSEGYSAMSSDGRGHLRRPAH